MAPFLLQPAGLPSAFCAALAAAAIALRAPASAATQVPRVVRGLGGGDAVAMASGEDFAPVAWYRFENRFDLGADSSPSMAHNFSAPNCTAVRRPNQACPTAESKGPVGGYVTISGELDATHPRSWGAVAPVPVGGPSWPGLTIELLLKPGVNFLRGGFANLLKGDTVGLDILTGTLRFTATTAGATGGGAPADVLSVPLSGAGVLATDYLFGEHGPAGGWHHIALVKDAVSGNQSVWIDGECHTATMAMPGNATGAHMAPSTSGITIDDRNAVSLDASLDEIAVYSRALPPSLIYVHFSQALNSTHGKPGGKPYTPTDPGGAAPPPPIYPAPTDPCDSTTSCYWDLEEFPAGTQLPSPEGDNNTVGGDVPCVWQMEYYAGPRYNLTAVAQYKTPFHFNWMDPHYMAGATDPTEKKFNPQLTVELQQAMADRWRFGPMFWAPPASGKGNYTPSTKDNLSLALFNAHPEWPMNVILPFGREFRNQTLSDGCYLQDASGHFIDVTGAPAPAGHRSLRPLSAAAAAAKGCPDTLWGRDGAEVAASLKKLAPYLQRPFTILNLDGEVFVSLDTPAEDYDFSKDPTVAADFDASGAPNWLSYWSAWRVRLTNLATNPYMTDPDLSKGVLKGAALTMYQVQGTNGYFGNWTETRHIMTPMATGRGGPPQYYSTCDLYLQSPREWWGGGGPDHGLEWLASTRASELADGDALSSPFVAAGWSGKAEHNVRPAQWLGLLKIIAAWGAEWFYAGFFNVKFDAHGQMPDSGQWCWQGMAPAFAQASVVTAAADVFYKGGLVPSDANTSYSGDKPSPWLWAGQPNIVAVARELNGVYLIVLAVQRLSNAKLALAAPDVSASLRVPGIATPLKVQARLQGSVYVFRNDTGAKATLYQLDAWHLASHPSYWPTDAADVEAEVLEGHLGASVARALVTELADGAAHDGDFVGAVTSVDLREAATLGVTVAYNLSHHGFAAAARLPRGDKAGPAPVLSVSVLAKGGSVVVNGGRCGAATAGRAGGEWEWIDVGPCEDAAAAGVLTLKGTAKVDRIRLGGGRRA